MPDTTFVIEIKCDKGHLIGTREFQGFKKEWVEDFCIHINNTISEPCPFCNSTRKAEVRKE